MYIYRRFRATFTIKLLGQFLHTAKLTVSDRENPSTGTFLRFVLPFYSSIILASYLLSSSRFIFIVPIVPTTLICYGAGGKRWIVADNRRQFHTVSIT